eukprot:1564044-Rhodomonas_salina.1
MLCLRLSEGEGAGVYRLAEDEAIERLAAHTEDLQQVSELRCQIKSQALTLPSSFAHPRPYSFYDIRV